jgi:hypothetical protein
VTSRTDPDSACYFDLEGQTKPTEDAEQMDKIKLILESLPEEEVNRWRLNEITAILEMNVYLVSNRSRE